MTPTDRLAEVLDRLGALAQQTPAPSSTVELSQTTKGATHVTVKAYAASADEAAATAPASVRRARQPLRGGRRLTAWGRGFGLGLPFPRRSLGRIINPQSARAVLSAQERPTQHRLSATMPTRNQKMREVEGSSCLP